MDIYSSVIDNKTSWKQIFWIVPIFFFVNVRLTERIVLLCVLDGMVDSLQLSHMIMNPILNYSGDEKTNARAFETSRLSVVNSLELSEGYNL